MLCAKVLTYFHRSIVEISKSRDFENFEGADMLSAKVLSVQSCWHVRYNTFNVLTC